MLKVAAKPNTTLLLVDDDIQQLKLCAMVLQMSGFSVLTAASPGEAISVLAENAIDLAVLDYDMPEMNGCMLAGRIRARYCDISIILYSGALAIPDHEIIHVDEFVPKGRGARVLLAKISELIHARSAASARALAYVRRQP